MPERFTLRPNPVRIVVSADTSVRRRAAFLVAFPLGSPLMISSFVIQQMSEVVHGSLVCGILQVSFIATLSQEFYPC